MRRTPHSQGWHELDKLSQETHIERDSAITIARVGHGILITLGFLSLIGIVALFG